MSKENEEQSLYDIIVIGAGPGGYHAAIRAAQYGAKVAIIEKTELGGVCSNLGCIPTKALYASAHLIEDLEEKAERFGIELCQGLKKHFKQAVENKNQVVCELREGIYQLLKARKVDIFTGFGKLEGGNKDEGFKVSYENEGSKNEIVGKRVIIATGSQPALIPAFNIDHKRILTSDDVLAPDFDTAPSKLLIIGAGVIGCEFANIFSRFGSKVVMLEYLPTMLATEDRLVIREIKKKFESMGIEIYTNQNVLKVENLGDKVRATTCDAKVPKEEIESAEKKTFEADMCLVSIGRSKNYKGLGFEEMGGQIERRAIAVDKYTFETSIPGIYAIGDVNNQNLMLAHVASKQGDIAVEHALSTLDGFGVEFSKKKDYVVPYSIFTSPEVGTVGIPESKAKEIVKSKGSKLYSGRFSYSSLGKAKCMGIEQGFMKIWADAEDGKIYGATCVGYAAPELIAVIAVAMQNNLSIHDVADTVFSHPTISEIVMETAEDVFGMAIHKANRPKIKKH
ncbi:MAG: dihydrolipoyl dehydrogenase [Promethearchaeota archaeon]